ncbi:MAG TPA: penicillin-binding protein 1A [Acidiferrobacteraceae bacterium]|nr:penicillin-binding protein 1A [Acidiferrobacteraceae bacterium]
MTFRPRWPSRLPRTPLALLLATLVTLTVLGALALGIVVAVLTPGLPSVRVLAQHQFTVPLRIYTRSGQLIGQFGEENRVPVALSQVPPLQIKALLAAEDADFYSEPGVNFGGMLRAAWADFRAGAKVQGASTITMQVARDYFLSPKKTWTRKIREVLLAFKINRRFSKNQILELYINKVFLGNHAYGLGAAAEIYYGRSLAHLDLAQMAMLAGLPKAPSADNPVRSPSRALARRSYVLKRMRALGFITAAQWAQANAEGVHTRLHGLKFAVQAPYVAEMVREYMAAHYDAKSYADGFRVYTTLSGRDQVAADQALRRGLLAYDRRHGYRGPIAHVHLARHPRASRLDGLLKGYAPAGDLVPAVVTAVGSQVVEAYTQEGDQVEVGWNGLSWARRYESANRTGPEPTQASDILHRGDIIDLQHRSSGWWLAEVPAAEAALVSLRPQDGALLALSGGFDFYLSNFNRATQALRQPGSDFKPFIYSAALHKGFTAASMLSGAPIVVNDPSLEEQWRPEDYSKKFFGPTRLRKALALSLNLVAVRLLRAIGPDYAANYLGRFGFDPKTVPHDLSLVLGTASVTPLRMVTAFAVFANGGYRVHPYFIARVEDAHHNVLEQAQPATVPANPDAPPPHPAARVISADNAFIMTSMMKDVVRYGTGAAAAALGRTDIAGKTGTTNNQRDAWFSGFNPDVVTSVWVGFDQPAPLGHGEVGAVAALPIWMDYMKTALAGIPVVASVPPPGIVEATINRDTGALTVPTDPRAMREYFVNGTAPTATTNATPGAPTAPQSVRQGLF